MHIGSSNRLQTPRRLLLGAWLILCIPVRAYALASDNPAVVDTLGWLLVESGDPGRGLSLLQQAIAKAPHVSEIRYHLAVGLHKMGRNSEAKSELKRALDAGSEFTEVGEARALLGKLEKI